MLIYLKLLVENIIVGKLKKKENLADRIVLLQINVTSFSNISYCINCE